MNKALFLKGLALASVILLSACERPPMDSVQRGYRGTGMVQVYNPRTIEQNEELHAAPVALPPATADGPKAGKAYQNVKVLGDLSVAQFTQPVPSQIWFKEPPQANGADFIGGRAGQNLAAKSVGLSSLPSDPFTPFLLDSLDIRVNGDTALPSGNRHSIKQAEWTYGLMTHMSSALGVNCTYCHNSRSFSSWEGNPPQRVTAWHGIRMARELNLNYLEPLQATFPSNRKGELGDVAKLNCATCHQGAYKPLNGAPMIKNHPELVGKPAPAQVASAKP